jgi:hypothetical protein
MLMNLGGAGQTVMLSSLPSPPDIAFGDTLL